jgi:hypothetical protein
MTEKKIHIVSFDVPYPPDYGGVMDVFYRLKALKNSGCKVHLHCFEYGRGEQEELKKYADEVTYYKRSNRLKAIFKRLPMIVSSRANSNLLVNLLKDEAPILFEGQHCSYFLDHPKLKDRKKYVRIHNIEHEYYRYLALQSRKSLKKAYYKQEAFKLRKQEVQLAHADCLFCLTESDQDYYAKLFQNAFYLPVAFPLTFLESSTKENFSLFHGNLSVVENSNAVRWLIDYVAPNLNHPLYIAGKSPDLALKRLIASNPDVSLIENPSKEQLQKLLKSVRAHVLPTFQPTGIKLKLLHALTTNAPVVVTPLMVENTDLANYCSVVSNPEECINVLNEMKPIPLSNESWQLRKQYLEQNYGEKLHAQLILNEVF